MLAIRAAQRQNVSRNFTSHQGFGTEGISTNSVVDQIQVYARLSHSSPVFLRLEHQ